MEFMLCARPACRTEFHSDGRRHCSDQCEQAAQRELATAQDRLRGLTTAMRQAQADVAAFTADRSDSPDAPSALTLARALAAAQSALRYLSTEDPGIEELQRLVDAVAIEETRSAAAAEGEARTSALSWSALSDPGSRADT